MRRTGRALGVHHRGTESAEEKNKINPYLRVLCVSVVNPSSPQNEKGQLLGLAFNINLGNDLLSQHVTMLVPSALVGLTAVFGMGTGVSPPVRSPKTFCLIFFNAEFAEISRRSPS